MTTDADNLWDRPVPDDEPGMLRTILERLLDLNERLEGIEADVSFGGFQEQLNALDKSLKELREESLNTKRSLAHHSLQQTGAAFLGTTTNPEVREQIQRILGGTTREIQHVDNPMAIVNEAVDALAKLLLRSEPH